MVNTWTSDFPGYRSLTRAFIWRLSRIYVVQIEHYMPISSFLLGPYRLLKTTESWYWTKYVRLYMSDIISAVVSYHKQSCRSRNLSALPSLTRLAYQQPAQAFTYRSLRMGSLGIRRRKVSNRSLQFGLFGRW